MVSGDFLIFSSKMSFLLRNRIMDVSVNHLLLQMLSKSFRDSCMRFCNRVGRCVRVSSVGSLTHHSHDTAGQAKGRATHAAERITGGGDGRAHRTNRTYPCFIPHTGRVGWSWGGKVEVLPPFRGSWPCGAVRSLERLQLLERTCTMHMGTGLQPPSNRSTQNRRSCRFLYRGLIWFCQQGWEVARIQLGNINRGLRDPRINPELEADTGDIVSG